VWAAATANERARACVMGGGHGDVGVEDVINEGRGAREGGGRAGGFPGGCLRSFFPLWSLMFQGLGC
jgi:hypothetical protein